MAGPGSRGRLGPLGDPYPSHGFGSRPRPLSVIDWHDRRQTSRSQKFNTTPGFFISRQRKLGSSERSLCCCGLSRSWRSVAVKLEHSTLALFVFLNRHWWEFSGLCCDVMWQSGHERVKRKWLNGVLTWLYGQTRSRPPWRMSFRIRLHSSTAR